MTDGEKEQIKMRATFHNGIGLAIVAVGGLGPTIALMNKQMDQDSVLRGALIFWIAYLIGWGFHLRAIFILDGLDRPLPTRRDLYLSIAGLAALSAVFCLVLYLLVK